MSAPPASSGITVAVRLRPFNQREIRLNCTNVVAMPAHGKVTISQVRNGKVCDSEKPREFNFDECFWTHDARPSGEMKCDLSTSVGFADQQVVFDRIGEPCVRAVLDGFNGCLFAYGQTGSGKTYTMMGYQQDPGLIPRMCGAVFAVSADDVSKASTLMSVECSYMEIYNERVIDLLDSSGRPPPEGGLRVRQHPSTGVFVEGLRKFAVAGDDEVLQLVAEGDRRRTVAATNMNAVSSRSHAILILYVSQTKTDASGGTSGKSARMSLVDLAGSERVSSTGAEGDTLAEGASINKSLTVLGMCLARLADASESASGKSSLPIPFRDSNLTFILNESLGGNSKTTMIAAVSPADVNADETVSTLRFAQITKRVKTKPVINENPNAKVIRELKQELSELRERLASLLSPAQVDMVAPSAREAGELHDVNSADAVAELQQQIEESAAAIEAEETTEQPARPLSMQDPAPQRSEAAHAPPGAIFLDWSRPNLINASTSAVVPVVPLAPGRNVVLIDDNQVPGSHVSVIPNGGSQQSFSSAAEAQSGLRSSSITAASSASLVLDYAELRQEVTLIASEERLHDAIVAVNGEPLQAVGGGMRQRVLAHNDRIVFGMVVFRFAHPASLAGARDFSCCPVTLEHVVLLEELHRRLVLLDEHRVYLADFRVSDGDEEDERIDEDDGRRRLAESDETSERISHERNVLELELAALYPPTGEELRRTSTAALDASAASNGQLLEADRLLSEIVALDTHSSSSSSVTLVNLTDIIGSYNAAIEEREAAILAQRTMISELRKTLHDQLRRQAHVDTSPPQAQSHRQIPSTFGLGGGLVPLSAERGESDDTESAVSYNEQETQAVQAAMEEELQWHSTVINLRQFKPHGPLDDPVATAIWTRVAFGEDAAKKPFFKEIKQRQIASFHEQQEAALLRRQQLPAAGEETLEREDSMGASSPLQRRMSSMLLLSPWRPLHLATISQQPQPATAGSSTGSALSNTSFSTEGAVWRSGPFFKLSHKSEKWEQRYALICDKFLYYFYECDGTQRAIAAIYLYGATFTVSARQIAKRDHCILLTTTTPRRVSDGRSSYYLSFRTSQDRLMWCHWIAEASVPPLPRSMASRLRDELQDGRTNGSLFVQAIEQRADLVKYFYVPLAEWGFPDVANVKDVSDDKRSHMNWDADETTANCTQCQLAFSFFRRRHHCRSCGRIFCSACTTNIPMRNEKGETKPKRACRDCSSNSTIQAVAGVPRESGPPAAANSHGIHEA